MRCITHKVFSLLTPTYDPPYRPKANVGSGFSGGRVEGVQPAAMN